VFQRFRFPITAITRDVGDYNDLPIRAHLRKSAVKSCFSSTSSVPLCFKGLFLIRPIRVIRWPKVHFSLSVFLRVLCGKNFCFPITRDLGDSGDPPRQPSLPQPLRIY
jgi:hypothetical protein